MFCSQRLSWHNKQCPILPYMLRPTWLTHTLGLGTENLQVYIFSVFTCSHCVSYIQQRWNHARAATTHLVSRFG